MTTRFVLVFAIACNDSGQENDTSGPADTRVPMGEECVHYLACAQATRFSLKTRMNAMEPTINMTMITISEAIRTIPRSLDDRTMIRSS